MTEFDDQPDRIEPDRDDSLPDELVEAIFNIEQNWRMFSTENRGVTYINRLMICAVEVIPQEPSQDPKDGDSRADMVQLVIKTPDNIPKVGYRLPRQTKAEADEVIDWVLGRSDEDDEDDDA